MAHIATPATADHASWTAFLGAPDSKRIGHNTYAIRTGENFGLSPIAIRLHWTNVVTFRHDGSIVLNSGGYRSVTTKQRMNAVLPPHISVVQRNFEWFVLTHVRTIPFEDGMVLTAGVTE